MLLARTGTSGLKALSAFRPGVVHAQIEVLERASLDQPMLESINGRIRLEGSFSHKGAHIME